MYLSVKDIHVISWCYSINWWPNSLVIVHSMIIMAIDYYSGVKCQFVNKIKFRVTIIQLFTILCKIWFPMLWSIIRTIILNHVYLWYSTRDLILFIFSNNYFHIYSFTSISLPVDRNKPYKSQCLIFKIKRNIPTLN